MGLLMPGLHDAHQGHPLLIHPDSPGGFFSPPAGVGLDPNGLGLPAHLGVPLEEPIVWKRWMNLFSTAARSGAGSPRAASHSRSLSMHR